MSKTMGRRWFWESESERNLSHVARFHVEFFAGRAGSCVELLDKYADEVAMMTKASPTIWQNVAC